MKKEKQQKTTKSQQRLWIGVGVVAIVAVALAFGLGALSIQPQTGLTGTATVSFYTRDGTQVNASSLSIKIYTANASGVNESEVKAFYQDFANYEEETLNASNIEGLNLVFEIKKDIVALLKIESGTYFEDWVILKPGDQSVILNEKPNEILMTRVPQKYNETSSIMEGYTMFHLGKVINDVVWLDHPNCSILGYWDDYSANERVYLTLKFDNSQNYTSKVMNVTYGQTFIYNGDMYIRLNGDIRPGNRFDFTLDVSAIGSPSVTIGWVWDDDLSTYQSISAIQTII